MITFTCRTINIPGWFFPYICWNGTLFEAPRHRLKKPETGRYHLVRLIRSDSKLNIIGEIFRVPPELQLEYVVATIHVKEQKLKLFLDKIQVDEFNYKLR